MAKIRRNQVKHFLNTGTLISPTWSLIGEGVTSGTINMNPNTLTETYIHEANASISVESYAPTFPIEATAVKGDAVFDWLDAKRKLRAALDTAETEIVSVWIYETPANGYYVAEKQSCSIQFDSFGGDGGLAAKLNYTINFIGDPVKGIFKPAATATFAAGPVDAVLATMVIGAITLVPLFATDPTNLLYTASVANGVGTATMTSTCIAAGASIVQKFGSTVVAQGDPATLSVGVTHLSIEVTVGSEVVTYYIDITRAAA